MTARSRWRRYFFDRFKRPVRHFFDRFKHPGRHFLARSKMKAQRRAKRQSKYAALKKLGELPPKAGGTASPNAGGIPPPSPFSTDYKDFLLEAYKKHSTELASIEDRLNKLLLIILGVFGAGATAISRKIRAPAGPVSNFAFEIAVAPAPKTPRMISNSLFNRSSMDANSVLCFLYASTRKPL